MTQIQTTEFISTEKFVAELISEFPILKPYVNLDRKLYFLSCVYTFLGKDLTILLSHTENLFDSPKSISPFLAQHIKDRLQTVTQLIQDSKNKACPKDGFSIKEISKPKTKTKEGVKAVLASSKYFFIYLESFMNGVELQFYQKEYCPFLSEVEFLKANNFHPRYDRLIQFNQLYKVEIDEQLDGYEKVYDVNSDNWDFSDAFRIDPQCCEINYNSQVGAYSLMVDRVFPNLETDYSFEKIKGGIFLNQELSYEPYYFLKQPIEIPLDQLLVEGVPSVRKQKVCILDRRVAALKKALDNDWITSGYLNDERELQTTKEDFYDMLNQIKQFTDAEKKLFRALKGIDGFFKSAKVIELITTKPGRPSTKK